MKEFELIEKYFATTQQRRDDVILGIGDDCAILRAPSENDLVVTIDALIENVHFPKTSTPFDLGYKSLAISLSDIAAMGAEPAWVLLSLNMPKVNEIWLEQFCAGFFKLANKFSLQLVGGNTAQGPLAITTQVTGFVPHGTGLRRSNAQPGDLIYVTGTLGDAALGLRCLQKKNKIPKDAEEELLLRFNRPEPRVKEGLTLRELATAAIDVSDGLAADLSHILRSSKVGATIKTEKLPLSKTLRTYLKREDAWHYALTGGEDYELCFTLPRARQGEFEWKFGAYDCGYICIGVIEQQPGLRMMMPDGKPFKLSTQGYEHFS